MSNFLRNNSGGSDGNDNNNNSQTLKERQAEVLLRSGIQAFEQRNLDDALTFYMESIQLYMEIYRDEPDGSTRKANLYALMEANLIEAEKIKAQIRDRDQRKVAAEEAAKTSQQGGGSNLKPAPNESSIPSVKPPKTTRRDPSTKPLPLPDTYDFTTQKKPSANGQKTAGGLTPTGKGTTTAGGKKGGTTPGGKVTETAVTTAPPKPNEYTSQIMEEILDKSPCIRWDDIAGLAFAKQTLQEAVILPNLRPDLFTGLRAPPKGVLLYGPPGTGKTLLAKAVATESGFVFFSISASSVTSKYLGEGEKLIKALFDLARQRQPAVIFIDEIDSLMSARKDNEHEASRRLKTEFMTQLDGAASSSEDRILVMGATNLPWDIDEAVLRRMPKRIYVPLPDNDSRRALITHLLKKQGPAGEHFKPKELDRLVSLTEGYSGSDLAAVCSEAALGPIREIGPTALKTIRSEDVRPISVQDFVNAIRIIRPSVSGDSLKVFQKWSDQFGVTR